MKKTLTYIALILYFFSGTIYVISRYNRYQLPMLLLSIILIIITHLSAIRYLKIPSRLEDISYILFSISIMLSSIFNNEISTAISGIGMLVLWLAFSVWMPKDAVFETGYLEKIYYIILMPYVLLILYSYLLHPISLIRYEGVFRTANGMGDAAATACAVILAKIVYDYTNSVSKINKYIDFIILFFSIFNCLISTCRGAIVSVLIMLFLSAVVITHDTNRSYKKIVNIVLGFFVLILLFLLLYNTTVLGDIIKNIITKFQDKSNDALDGRTERWDQIFARAKLFGNGEKVNIAAHNSFFSLLDQYGYLSFVFFIIYSITTLIKSVKIAWNIDIEGSGKFLPLMSCVGFISMSMTEGMMLKTIMLIVIFCFPLFRGEFLHIKSKGQV